MNSISIRSAVVDILFYRNDLRDWRKPDGAEVGSTSEEGRATVHLIQEPEPSCRYRIYAVRNVDDVALVNQLLYENFHYKVATPVFHQWKNEEKQVIGLNFLNPNDATVFSQSIKHIIERLNVPQYQQVNNNVSNGVYQDPQAYYQQNNKDTDQESIGSGHSALTNYRQQQQKSSYSSLQNGQPGVLNQQQQRRCSQGSSGSSGTPSSSTIYATAQPVNGNGSTTNGHHSSSNGIPVVKAPVPPPAPPPPPSQLNLSSGSSNSNGSSNIAQISKNAPPAPPPPPPGLSLADQLKNSTLRKTSAPVNKVTSSDTSQTPSQQHQPKLSTSNAPNFVNELEQRLNKIKIGKNCNADTVSTSSSSGVSTASSGTGISSDNNTSDSGATIVATKKPGETSNAPKPWAKPNGNVAGITSISNGTLDSPKGQRKIINSSSVENSSVTVADLEQFKQDILTEVNKTKQEVTEIRQEIAKVVKMQQEMFEAIRASLQRKMDFLQASIDAALKNGDYPDDENLDDSLYEGVSYNGFNIDDANSYGIESPENADSLNEDEEPPILEESGFNDSALSTISQVLTAVNNNGSNSTLPPAARAYQEDVIPLEKCKFNGNRLLIEGCKYEFVRLNVRANVYFRCVVCYGIYQRRRAVVTKSGLQVDVPSVGSLKLVASTGEIRGNPDQPSGIPHCCEVEKYRETVDDDIKREIKKEAAIKRDSNAAAVAASAIDPLSLINQAVSNNGIQNSNFNNNNIGVDDEEVVPLEKCKFNDKRLEIEGCKYVFSRTQSGPRDYYRCTACIALYHKRHFRKLPTPKIGSLSLVRETGVLTGNPEMPRGLPHICDNFELHCAPIRPDNSKPKFRQQPPPLAGIYEAARSKWPNQSPSLSSSRPTQNLSSPLLRSPLITNSNGGLQKRQNDFDPPLAKYRKLIETVMGPAPTPSTKLNYNPSSSSTSAASPPSLKHGSTGSGKLEDEESEYTYPHTNDLQTPPNKSLPDFDLAFLQRKELLSMCFQSFPKLPNQARVLIFADTLLKAFNPKNLNPSASIVRVEFPLTPTHLVFDLFRKAKDERDCFSKTKHVFFTLGYDVIRCMDVESLSRRINVVQNEFFQMRDFFDNNYDREIMLTFVTVPEMGVLTDELRSFNHGMKSLIAGKNRKDMIVCDWAQDHSISQLQNVEDRIHVLMNKMSEMCGLELLDED